MTPQPPHLNDEGAALFVGFSLFWLVLGWLLALMTAFYLSTLAELRHMLA